MQMICETKQISSIILLYKKCLSWLVNGEFINKLRDFCFVFACGLKLFKLDKQCQIQGTFNLVWVLCCTDGIERPLIGLHSINGIKTFWLQVLLTWSLTFEESLEVTKGAKFFVYQTMTFMISIFFSYGLLTSLSMKIKKPQTSHRQNMLKKTLVMSCLSAPFQETN